MKKKILIVDDELGVRESIKMILKKDYELVFAENGKEAIEVFFLEQPDLLLVDIIMPHIDGISVLKEIKKLDPNKHVIMITATKTLKTAVDALKMGAFDYITKPFDIEELKMIIAKALAVSEKYNSDEVRESRGEYSYELSELIGISKPMLEIFRTINQIAKGNATILIYGERGTGKELIAKTIHYISPRRNRAFISINCSAISASTIEAELFGCEQGSILSEGDNRYNSRYGILEQADCGTIFLDEIGDMDIYMQSELLRFLQEKEFCRIGGKRAVKANIRLIAATNKSLETEVKKGRFRPDLFYRLNVVPIYVPPLRERKEDILLLINYFLALKSSRFNNKKKIDISEDALGLLMNYSWPENVRELEGTVDKMVALLNKDTITIDDIPNFQSSHAQ